MKICVCVKQVPAKSVPIDSANGILDRSKAGGKLNPWDSYALEAALRIKETFDGEITAITMGPPSAESTLREAFSLGIDHAVLLTDKAFSGADVYATAKTVAAGIDMLGSFDLILCGQQSTDGDTAQFPSSLATFLGLPVLSWIKKIEFEKNKLILLQELTFGTQKIELHAPAVLSVGAGIGSVRMPSLKHKLKAKSKEILVLHLSDLKDKNPENYGLKASPTNVCHIEEALFKEKAPLETLSPSDAAKKILHVLKHAKEEN